LVLVGIFLVFYQPIPKENLVGTFWYHKIGWSPFFPPKRGPLDPFGALSPPFEGKRVSADFFKKKNPETSKKSSRQILQYKKCQPDTIPTG
jgi:hypothetical protein